MSQNLNSRLKYTFLIAIPLALIAWAWLAGYFYLEIAGLNSGDASPTTIFDYWRYYGKEKETQLWLGVAALAALLIICLPFVLIFIPPKRKLFGNAGWATSKDIRESGLYEDNGIIVGLKSSLFGLFKRYLFYGGDQHVLMVAPTRGDKGVSVVIPNLLSWKDSCVVLDIKRENWNITSGFRSKHGQECYLLNLMPRDHCTHKWNPLFYISEDPVFRIDDIQKIGQMLFPNLDNEAPIWQSSSRSLWLGLVLYLLETNELPKTIGEAFRQLLMGDDRLSQIVEKRKESGNPLSDECYLALKEYLDTPSRTRGSVRKSFTSTLAIFYNPAIDATTSGNDFDLRDLRKKRISIYIAIPFGDLDRMAPLVNLFFQQMIDLNTREPPETNKELKYKVLVLPDEFAALGKVGILSKGISFIAGYGLRMLTVIQSPKQMYDIYGAYAAENFIENHALQIVFAPKNNNIAREISEALGKTTVTKKSSTRQLSGKYGRTESSSDFGRDLLLPQEVKQIGRHAEILLLENCPPVKCEKIMWFKDKKFIKRGNGREAIQWPNPDVPSLDLDSRVKGEINTIDANETRSITEKDLETLDKLELKDFSCDFSQIKIPQGKINSETMDSIVDEFFNVMSPA